MGDHHLNIGQPVFDWISMCQNRSGRPRSIVSSKAAHADQGKRHVIGHAHARPIVDVAEQVGQGRHHVGPGRNPAEKEIPDDQSMPLGVGDGRVELEVHRLDPPLPSRHGDLAFSPAERDERAEGNNQRGGDRFQDDGQTERLGTWACTAVGSP